MNKSRQWRKIDALLGLPVTAKERVVVTDAKGNKSVRTIVVTLRPGQAQKILIVSTKGSFTRGGFSATARGSRNAATRATSRPHGETRKQTREQLEAIRTLNERRLNALLAKQ